MDQLKTLLEQAKKHHFWLLCAFAVLASLTTWYFSKKTLAATFVKGREEVRGQFRKVQTVVAIEPHQNDKWTAALNDLTKNLRTNVADAWQKVYDHQRETVLKWPEGLGDDFIKVVQELGPKDDIPIEFCERYRDYINQEFPGLLKIVSARSFMDQEHGPTDEGFKIIWADESQKSLYTTLRWNATPTPREVRNAQENLWVYQALLTIISKVNERSRGVHTSKIRSIDTLSIGQDAAKEFLAGMGSGKVWRPANFQAAVQDRDAPLPPPAALLAAERAKDKVNAAAKGVAEDGRYVDQNGRPLGVGKSANLEFKRMPVHLKLKMDQLQLSRLLVECVNSPLPVEVRQVRLNRDLSFLKRSKRKGKPMDPAALLAPKIDKGLPGKVEVLHAAPDDDTNPYEVEVEIHGIIYIFNPPDLAKLGVPAPVRPVAAEGVIPAPVEGEAPPPAADAAPGQEPAAAPAPEGGAPPAPDQGG